MDFITRWSDEEFDSLYNKAIEQTAKLPTINRFFTKEWLADVFETRFNKGIPPMIHLLTQPRLESSLVVIDKVFSTFDSSDKEFLDKIYRIQQYLSYQTMKNYFTSTMLELYLHAYLSLRGIDCSFRRGAGADLEVKTDNGIIDIEVTTRYNDLLDEEFKDLLLRCIPDYRIKIKGRFESSKSMYLGMADLQRYVYENSGTDDRNNILELGLNNEVTIELTKMPGNGYIVSFDEPHFIGAEMVHKQVGYKLRDKADNPNQTGTGRPVIVVVGVSNIDDSAAIAIMNDYKFGVQYSPTQIPSKIDAVSMYWLDFNSIEPARAIGTLNEHISTSIIDPVILEAFGIK